jgi:hypothetical protein
MRNWPRRIVVLAIFAALQLTAEVRTLTILRTNDLHSRLSPLDNHHGGFAYLARHAWVSRDGARPAVPSPKYLTKKYVRQNATHSGYTKESDI